MERKSVNNQKVLSTYEKKYLKNMVNQKLLSVQEKKSFDFGFSASVDSTGAVAKITSIPQGDTDSSRQGDHIKLLKAELRAAASYADTTNVVRLIIFKWNQDDSSAAPVGVTSILQTATPFSPYDRDNERAGKFTIVVDHLFGVSNVGQGIATHEWYGKLTGQIAYQAASTAGTGNLYYAVISDSNALPHNTLSYVWRTYYTDS